MRKDFGVKTWMYPLPVLIIGTYDEEGNANAMNAAWGCIYNDDLVEICLSAGHKTTKNIKVSKAFTISFATRRTTAACDYLGIESGNRVPDKLSRAGFTTTKSAYVNAPVINELPLTMECELVEIRGENIVGRIRNVSADESILDEDGCVDYRKLDPITFDAAANQYVALGDVVARAFDAGKKFK